MGIVIICKTVNIKASYLLTYFDECFYEPMMPEVGLIDWLSAYYRRQL